MITAQVTGDSCFNLDLSCCLLVDVVDLAVPDRSVVDGRRARGPSAVVRVIGRITGVIVDQGLHVNDGIARLLGGPAHQIGQTVLVGEKLKRVRDRSRAAIRPSNVVTGSVTAIGTGVAVGRVAVIGVTVKGVSADGNGEQQT